MAKVNGQEVGFGRLIWEYLTTVDHKKIAILYLIAGGFFFVMGGIEAMLIRIQLAVPNNDFLSAGLFNEMITMHGTTMIFLAAMPIIFAFMNAVVPLQIGARDLAFPFMNALGVWMFILGGIFLNISWLFGDAPDAGWTSYASLSIASPGHGIDFYAIGLQIAGAGTLITGINFVTTIITMRAPGMTYMRMPLFTWTALVASILIVFGFPPLTVGLFLLTFDRMFGSNFFIVEAGGNTIIWEHLFWIFGHPEVYILILPAFGIFSEIFAVFSRKRLFGYSAMVFATVLIGFFGFMVWAHHMFTVGLGPTANAIFALATMAIAVPTGIKIFNWIATIWGGSITFTTPMLYALAFIPSFVMGGVTGIMQSVAPADYQYHDSYFIVAHFHYVIVGGVVFAILAGLHYWWPLMFGTKLNETLGKIEMAVFAIGFHMTFLIQHWLGLWGMPRRVFTYLDGQGLNVGNLVSTIGALLMAVGVIVLVINIIITVAKNDRVVDVDIWDGRTLEWSVAAPTPEYNFFQTPLVRGLDALQLEKEENNGEIPAAGPVEDIHMPNNSIIPLILSLGLFIAGFGALFHASGQDWAIPAVKDLPSMRPWSMILLVGGLSITFLSMMARSWIDDHGHYVKKERIEKEMREYEERKRGAN